MNRPPKPPKPSSAPPKASSNPFAHAVDDEDVEQPVAPHSPVLSPLDRTGTNIVETQAQPAPPGNGRASRNPFAEDGGDGDAIELRYVSTNPFADPSSTPEAPEGSRPPGKGRSSILAALTPAILQPMRMAHSSSPSRSVRASRRGYNPFDSEDLEANASQGSTPQRHSISVLKDLEEEEELEAQRAVEQAAQRAKQVRLSSDQRNQFRKSLRKIEKGVDTSGDAASAHCIDDSKENTVIRFLLSKRVFGYPHSNGKLLSNYYHYILNNHPLLSMLFRHPKNVYTRSQRLVVYLNALFFAVFVSFVLLGTTTVKQVTVCRLGCDTETLNTSSIMQPPHRMLSEGTNSTRCVGGYNDGLLESSYDDQCAYYYPWLVSLVCGLFVTLYSSLLEFLATCSCMHGHKTCQVYMLGRCCKSLVAKCGGTVLAFCTVISSILMLYAVIGSVVLDSDHQIVTNTLFSKLWAAGEWFVYSFPYFCVKYPTDRKYFYETQRAKEQRNSRRLSGGNGGVSGDVSPIV